MLYIPSKEFKFTHNDLHINNIMYTKTDGSFLYYKFNNVYFKVPTYGYVFKIIDFGRAIFTYQNYYLMIHLVATEKLKVNIHVL